GHGLHTCDRGYGRHTGRAHRPTCVGTCCRNWDGRNGYPRRYRFQPCRAEHSKQAETTVELRPVRKEIDTVDNNRPGYCESDSTASPLRQCWRGGVKMKDTSFFSSPSG